MRAKVFGKLDERRIRWLLAAFFVALVVPAVVLIAQAYSQLKWQSFRQNQLLAEDFAARVDADLRAGLAAEEARSFGDYSFLVVEGDAAANFVQRSPLSAYPVASAVAGALGYFQVDAVGRLSTPLLPADGVDAASYGIGAEEQAARLALAGSIADVLAQNRLAARGALVDSIARDNAPPPASARFASGNERELRRAATADRDAEAGAAAPEEVVVTGSRLPLNDLVQTPVVPALAPAPQVQAEFDRLAANVDVASRGQVAGAGAQRADAAPVDVTANAKEVVQALPSVRNAVPFGERQKRTEQALEANVVGDLAKDAAASSDEGAAGPLAAKLEVSVRTFESELDPFEVRLLETGHLVMFRNVWRDGQRYIQGALIDREQFLARSVQAPFAASSLAAMSDVGVAYQGQTLGLFRASGPGSTDSGQYASMPADLAGSSLYRARLSPPFGSLELTFNVNQLPRAPGTLLLVWVSVILAAVLCGGTLLMYRFAVGQLKLSRQQQDFVSAVSHELKTPLTSIRMYGEMLKAGWADEAKKQTYYDYIHSESERLSRLIENVLQLARLTRNTQHFDVRRVTVAELMDMVRSKVSTQVERAGFALELRNDAPADAEISVDGDSFAQIVINLVDNALKFSASAERRAVEIASRRESDGNLLFTVRDFGPGIPKGQMKKIFELFYRPENELTRETVGTGIGLALVRQLATAMGGRIDVRNCEPGAEFRLSFPAAK